MSGQFLAKQAGADGGRARREVIRFRVTIPSALAIGLSLVSAGCAADAKVQLAAADALRVVQAELATALNEYHADLSGQDTTREEAVAAAFIERVRRDVADESALAAHEAAFQEALARIRSDRQVEADRLAATRENLGVLSEIESDLRQLAIQRLTLDDEVRRYLKDWFTSAKDAVDTSAAGE
jgi:hypothetical protein